MTWAARWPNARSRLHPEIAIVGGGDSVPQKDELVLDKLIDNISVAAANKKPFAYAYQEALLSH